MSCSSWADPVTTDSPGSLFQGQQRCSCSTYTEPGQGKRITLYHRIQVPVMGTLSSSPSMTHWPQSIHMTERHILIPDHGTKKALKSPFLIQGHAWASNMCSCVMLDNWVTSEFTHPLCAVGAATTPFPKEKRELFHMCTHNPSGLFYSNTEI